ncbi:FACT complex subunit spt16 [Marasmius sp. AFHP31]|nr:FACT complex subunit spt16 [Marasmius sp. AFHP31]
MLVELNKRLFNLRVKRIYDGWNSAKNDEDYSSIADVEALLLLAGDPAGEDEPMRKGTSMQLRKIKGTSGNVPVEILAQAKAKEPPNEAVPSFFKLYIEKGKVGTLTKEAHTGKLMTEWDKLLKEAPQKPELVDMAPAVSAFMSVKDNDELKVMQTAANLTSTLLKYHVGPRLESILDKESKVTHGHLAAQIESRLGSGEGADAKGPDMRVWSKGKGLNDIDWQLVEFCYSPIIISRSSKTGYDLRYTAESTEDNIAHKGVLLVAFGMRYKSYCANIGRTFIVDPTPDQEAQLNLLFALQGELLSFTKDGVTARDVYQHAISYIKSHKPDLEKNFVKNIGFGTGVEFRDSAYLLSGKNTRALKEGMVLNLGLGFTGLGEGQDQYALHLVDTIKIGSDKSALMTEGMKGAKDCLFFLTGESEDEKPQKSEKKKASAQPRANGSPAKKTAGTKVLRNNRRAAQDEVHHTATAKLAEHQRELHERLQAEGLAKYSEEGGGTKKEEKGWKKFQSYKGDGALPPDIDKLRIVVDRKALTVILPIYGYAVPFHINTIKNVSKNDEGDYTYLRINFQTPGQLAGRKEDTPFQDPDATFIRSVSYKSMDGHRFDTIQKQITELKKEVNKREAQKKEMADVIDQGSLIELKGRRPVKMPEAFIRPAPDGKRLPGEVEIHQNGIRYQSPLGQKVDVLFSNVKHLFFQPCDHELLVIVHMHLKAPIMIGKKKTLDVQFFREATDVQFDETGNRKRKHRYGDEDEIEMEQQERKRRQMLNKEVKTFAEKISEAASSSLGESLDLDIPFRELSFEGVPFRTSARLQPTTDCLVHLTDPPFLVVTLADIEIASLERVQYSLKQFDLVLIFKDFTKAPLHINSIQSSQMDDVKQWLDSVDIAMAEGPVNLNWGPIMKHINESPYEFFQGGGWTFLRGTTGGNQSDVSDESETESEYAAESEAFEESESSAAESDYSDASASDDSGSDFGDGSDSDEGDDWDELERKAARADQKRADAKQARGSDDSSGDDRPKKKKAAPANGKKPNGKVKGKR